MRNVLITGAAGRLGTVLSSVFGEAGFRVAMSDLPNSDVHAKAEALRERGTEAVALDADVTDPKAVDGLVKACLSACGGIDVLVHAAGGSFGDLTGLPDPSFLEAEYDVWEQVTRVNLLGSANVVRSVGREMVTARHGTMLLVTSGAGVRPVAGLAPYGAAKAGVIALARSAALELGEYGVLVNAVNPGLMVHPSEVPDERTVRGYLEQTSLGRLSSAGDVARFILNLTLREAVSGQVFSLDSRYLG